MQSLEEIFVPSSDIGSPARVFSIFRTRARYRYRPRYAIAATVSRVIPHIAGIATRAPGRGLVLVRIPGTFLYSSVPRYGTRAIITVQWPA